MLCTQCGKEIGVPGGCVCKLEPVTQQVADQKPDTPPLPPPAYAPPPYTPPSVQQPYGQPAYPPPPQPYPPQAYAMRPPSNFSIKLSVNQWIVLGGCFVQLLFLIINFVEGVSGYGLMFGSEGSFAFSLFLFFPLLILAGLTLFLRGDKKKLIVMILSSCATYMSLAALILLGDVSSGAVAGAILFFILWIIITAFSVLELLNVNLFAGMGGGRNHVVPCPRCGALNFKGYPSCTQCGQPLYTNIYTGG